MRFRSAGLNLTIRTIRAAALTLGLTTLTVFASHAGPTPSPTATASPTPSPHCDMAVLFDKKCSVGGGGWQDSCVAAVGEEVTYHYLVEPVGGYALFEVEDDKLGVIGQSSGETLTRTTTLTETTTNWAGVTLIEIEPGCICLECDASDQVTVTVVTPTPTPTATPSPIPCEVAHPVDTVYTIAKGQSAPNNAKVSHAITGNIIDPGAICPEIGACTAHRIPVCAGTGVTITSTDSSGGATNTNVGKGNIACVGNVCSVAAVDVTEKFKSVSADGKDSDRVSLLPK